MAAQLMELRLARLEGAYEQIDKRLDGFERHVEARFNAIDARFDAIDARFASVDGRFTSIDGRFTSVDERLRALEAGQWRQIAVTLGTWTTTMLAILALFVRH